MNYHNITTDDMLNGSGLRTVLWVSGCCHHCDGCQNPETWDCDSGIPFDKEALSELFEDLKKPYIKGLTLSGGDPLNPSNIETTTLVLSLAKMVYPGKDIWVYTGFLFEDIKSLEIMKYIDVLVDGEYKKELADEKYFWAGSTNQRVILVQQSLETNQIILYET